MDSIQLALDYFNTHPVEKETFIRKVESQNNGKLHCYKLPNELPSPICVYCGALFYTPFGFTTTFCESDENPYKSIDVSGLIKKEEEKYFSLLKWSENIVRKTFKSADEITGEKLCQLHHTHGIDPLIVEDVFGIELPNKIHDEYLEYYELHKKTGKQGYKPEVIVAK